MKPPGWMRLEYVGKSANGLDYRIHVKRWHPGFWAFVLREWWRRR